MDHHATHEIKYENNLNEARQQHEDDFAYIIRIQKLHNIYIRIYTPRGEGKVELFKPVNDFDKDRKLKNIENLIERSNESQHKFYYCDRCTYWFNSQIKYDKHESNHSFKPEIVYPKKKHISFIKEI